MRFIRIFPLVGVAFAAAISISSAGAGPSRPSTPTRLDLSTRTAINAYLRSIGVDPAGVVVQRGRRNYAGGRCPGRGWSCTPARRVVQISTRGTWNKFECSPSNAEPSGEPPPTNPPDTCLVVQSSTDGDNVAVCREESDSPDVTQTCTIVQQSSTGTNRARVRQLVEQDDEDTASATQRADVTQHNRSGKNTLMISQKVSQDTDGSGYATVAQDLKSDQNFTITQDAVDGRQKAKIKQSTDQDAQVEDVSGGTQHESASLIGDVVHQTSAGKGTIRVTQREDQNEEAPQDSAVQQTIVGPMDCCTDQGTNPADDFEIDQKSVQKTTSRSAQLSEDMDIFCSSSGTCDGTQIAVENGQETRNSCSSSGSFCRATLVCTNGECSTFSCADGKCDIEGPPATPPILLGDANVEPGADYTLAGEAEAFVTTAAHSGTPGKLTVYVDSGSAATQLVAGLYSDVNGHPDALLAAGTLSSPAPGAWNDVILTSTAPLTAGTRYWIAVLGPAEQGLLRIRDHCCGTAGGSPAETSAEKSLSALPTSWTTGTTYNDGTLSAYG